VKKIADDAMNQLEEDLIQQRFHEEVERFLSHMSYTNSDTDSVTDSASILKDIEAALLKG
jgi:hypothetical protein